MLVDTRIFSNFLCQIWIGPKTGLRDPPPLPRGWIFQQDNDPKHRLQLLQEFFSKKIIRFFEWLSQSPGLNPIEHIWQELKLRIRTENYAKKAALWKKVQEEWKNISQGRIIKLIESMPHRCAAVIVSKGMATKYWWKCYTFYHSNFSFIELPCYSFMFST